MSKLLWKSLLLSTALVVGANVSFVSAQTANNEILDQIDQYNQEGVNSQGQIRSISELRDVSPRDWAYQALRNLVENYDCIEGYPNRTFRGDRALTRYEFAAGLNACLEKINGLPDGDYVSQEDFDQLKRLVDQFRPELEALGARIDTLEARVDELEDNQFSTTTKLSGEAIVALTDVFGGDFTGGTPSLGDDNNTILGDRVRLTLETSFNGDDKLVTRLAAGNLSAFSTFSGDTNGDGVADSDLTHPQTTQTFNLSPGNNNDVFIDWAAYYLPVGKSELYLAAAGGIHSDYVNTLNPYFEDYDGGNGALSTFASENPIYRIGGGAGVGFSAPLGDKMNVTVGYLADEASNPANGAGVFNGNYAMLGQVDFELGDTFNVGLTYVNAYNDSQSAIFDAGAADPDINDATITSTGVVGTRRANLATSAILPEATYGRTSGTVSNSYGAEVAWAPSDKISISGFFNYTDAIVLERGGAEIWSYGMGIAFPNLGKDGNVLGIFGGAQPYAGNVLATEGADVPYHIEAFYKYKVNENISITPGLIWLTSPEGDDTTTAVDDAIIGTLRTTFTF